MTMSTSSFLRSCMFAPLASLLLCNAAVADGSKSSDDASREFRTVLQKRGDTAVLVKYVMSVSGMGGEQQQDGQTQGTLVSADGLILVPGRVVSFDLRQITGAAMGSAGSPMVKSSHFRVQLPGSEEWQPADLVTRDTELGLAWLRLRKRSKLPYVDFVDSAKVEIGASLYFVMRTSDQLGSVPIVRGGYVLGETKVPRPSLLIDGTPGLAFDGEARPAGFADVDFSAMARSQTGGIGMNFGDSVFKMIPAERVGRVTAQAAKLPVVPPDVDDSESSPEPAVAKPVPTQPIQPTAKLRAPKHAVAPASPAPDDAVEPPAPSTPATSSKK